jgi:hypothetical protein
VRNLLGDLISVDLPQVQKTVIPEAILIGNPGSET